MTLRARNRVKLTTSRDWYRIDNKTDDEASAVYIYDEIGFFGVTAQQFVDDLNNIDAKRIDLHLNSPGGEVWDGLAIYNALRDHQAQVTVHVDGLAASAASFITTAADRVIMGRGAQMMIHDALGLTLGNAADHREMADLLDRTSNSIAEFYAARAGGTVEQWRQRMRDETWYIGEEAVKAGLADEAIGADRAAPAMARVANAIPDRSGDWDLSMYRYPGRQAAPDPFTAEAQVDDHEDTAPDPEDVQDETADPTTSPPETNSDEATSAPDSVTVTAETLRTLIDPAHIARLVADEVAARQQMTVVDMATPVHHPDTTDQGSWGDTSGTYVQRLPSPMTVATARRMYGWYDAGRVEDGEIVKDGCKLPHHVVDEDGQPGAAHLGGVRAALQRLPQSDIPAADQAAIRRHLQAHLDDAPDDEPGNRADPAATPTAPRQDPVPASAVDSSWQSAVAHLIHPPASTADDLLATLRGEHR